MSTSVTNVEIWKSFLEIVRDEDNVLDEKFGMFAVEQVAFNLDIPQSRVLDVIEMVTSPVWSSFMSIVFALEGE